MLQDLVLKIATNHATVAMLQVLLQFLGAILATILQQGKTQGISKCQLRKRQYLVALNILRYADVASVSILENELPVGGHALCSFCFREVFDDLDSVSCDFVVEQERLGAVDIHVILDAERSGGFCDIA